MKDIGLRIRETDISTGGRQVSQDQGTTLGDLLAAARRQYLPVLVCALIGIFIGAAHFATSPKQYFAQARVLVDDRLSALAAEITAITPLARDDTALLNEIEILNSLQLAAEVTRKTRLHRNPEFLNPPSSALGSFVASVKDRVRSLVLSYSPVEETTPVLLSQEQQELRQIYTTALFLQRDIKIVRVGNSFSISISFMSPDPQLSVQIVNAYADAYLADSLNANLEASNRTGEWMRRRLEELQENAKTAALEAEEFRANNKVSDLPGLREREQRAETLNALYNAIAARYEQISIEGSFPVTNGRILSSALASKNAASPILWQFLAIAGLLGIIFGFTIAVVREFKERYFRTGEDVEKFTGLSFLGYLPTFTTGRVGTSVLGAGVENSLERTAEFFSSRHRRALETVNGRVSHPVEPAVKPGFIPTAPDLFTPTDNPRSIYSETLRHLHATVEQSLSGKIGSVIGVTSMLPGEGSSTLAANYANLVAKLGARTLLIDAVLATPSLSTDLQYANQQGLANVLDGTCQLTDAIGTIPNSGLEFLSNGFEPHRLHASQAQFQQSMPKLIAALRTHYSYIIIDMSALGLTADAKILLPEIDRFVLTSEWGKTPRNLVQQFIAREPEISRKILGVMLSKVQVKNLSKYGSFGGSEKYLNRFSEYAS